MKRYSNIVLCVLSGIILLSSGCEYTRFYVDKNSSWPLTPSKPFPARCKFYISNLIVFGRKTDSCYLLNSKLNEEYPDFFKESSQSIPLSLYISFNPYNNNLFNVLAVYMFVCTLGGFPCFDSYNEAHIILDLEWPPEQSEKVKTTIQGNGTGIFAGWGAIFIPESIGLDVDIRSNAEIGHSCFFSALMRRYIVSLVSQLDREKVRRYYYNKNLKNKL